MKTTLQNKTFLCTYRMYTSTPIHSHSRQAMPRTLMPISLQNFSGENTVVYNGAIFILPRTVVSVHVHRILSVAVVLEEVVRTASDICSFPTLSCFITREVDLLRKRLITHPKNRAFPQCHQVERAQKRLETNN